MVTGSLQYLLLTHEKLYLLQWDCVSALEMVCQPPRSCYDNMGLPGQDEALFHHVYIGKVLVYVWVYVCVRGGGGGGAAASNTNVDSPMPPTITASLSPMCLPNTLNWSAIWYANSLHSSKRQISDGRRKGDYSSWPGGGYDESKDTKRVFRETVEDGEGKSSRFTTASLCTANTVFT